MGSEAWGIRVALDAGAHGIMIPLLSSKVGHGDFNILHPQNPCRPVSSLQGDPLTGRRRNKPRTSSTGQSTLRSAAVLPEGASTLRRSTSRVMVARSRRRSIGRTPTTRRSSLLSLRPRRVLRTSTRLSRSKAWVGSSFNLPYKYCVSRLRPTPTITLTPFRRHFYWPVRPRSLARLPPAVRQTSHRRRSEDL